MLKITDRLIIIALVLSTIIIFTTSARGCPKRKRDTKIGSSLPEWSLSAPSNLIATAISYTQINLSWTDNSNNEDGFVIERREWFGGTWRELTPRTAPNVTSYSDTEGLLPFTIYYYRVRGYNTIGDYSDYSNEANTITLDLVRVDVAAGGDHTLALTTVGTIWAWGRNSNGQLGLDDTNNRFAPTPVGTEIDWQTISCGYYHSLGIKNDRTLWSWGANRYGQLGMGDAVYENWVPFPVGTDSDWFVTDAGPAHTIALKTNRTIWAWGINYSGQLGLGDSGFGSERFTPTQIGTDSDWSVVDAGNLHTIGMKTNNTIWAWGSNSYGQLGVGNSGYGSDRYTPTQIGTESDWFMVASGGDDTGSQSVGLKINGTIWAWGFNWFGQLGLGDTINRNTPSQIGTNSDWSAVTVGRLHTLTRKTNSSAQPPAGTLWSWGFNDNGQLGLGDTGSSTYRLTPTQIGIGSDWSAIVAGGGFGIGFKSNGTIWAWGQNNYGQLGFGDTISRNIPYPLGSPTPPSGLIATVFSSTQISLSWTDRAYQEDGFIIERSITTNTNYSLLATVGLNTTSYSDGNLIFGSAYYYRVKAYNIIGDSPYSNYAGATPTVVAPSSLILTVISSYQIDLSWIDNSIDENGFIIELKIGRNGTYGEIATVNPNVTFYSYITTTSFAPNVTYYYRVKAYNNYGESAYTEAGIAISGDWATVDAGDFYSIGRRTNSTIWGWGKNDYYQLGLGNTNDINIPSPIGTDSDWVAITAGGGHTIARKTNNTLWSWGANKYGQLGLGNTNTKITPSLIGNASDWLTVIAGGYVDSGTFPSDIIGHTVALKTNGQLWAWGANGSGQLGDDSLTTRTTPRQIGTETDWTMITAGSKHTLSIKTNFTLWSWGGNEYGQLGLGDTIDRKTPSQIGTNSDWSMVVAAGPHTITLKRDGTIWTWGGNTYGQLGLGDTINRSLPTQVGTESDWSTLAAGGKYRDIFQSFIGHTIARKTDGVIWAWGGNSSGQLGLGDTINRTTPSQIGLITDWTVIIAGNQHTLVIKANATLWAWGQNNYGQLGLGDTIDRNIPMMVGE